MAPLRMPDRVTSGSLLRITKTIVEIKPLKKTQNFLLHVTGVVAFLIDANFGLMPLCEAVLRALLFGNAVVLVTALPHANALSRSGLDKLDAVALAAYPEDCPNAATEALAKDLCATSGLGALLFACSLTPARLIGRAAVSEGPRALCLEGWGQEDGVSGAELEVLQEMCVQHRAIWNPVLDAFAN